MLPTRDDVARLAGVSSATVSYVINNGPRPVAEETRRRVLAAIDQLGYEPSEVARSLKTKSTASIGLILSNIEMPFFARLTRGVQDAAAGRGYMVILASTDEQPIAEADYVRLLSSKRVDGVIIAPTNDNLGLLHALPARGIPVVAIDRRPPGLHVPLVGIDNRQAAYTAVTYLIGQGHRRIGMVTGLPILSCIADRHAGFRDAFQEAGMTVDEQLISIVDSHNPVQYPQASKSTLALLQRHPDITAIFATNVDYNLGVLHALHAANLHCPQDMSVVGFDDLDYFEFGTVPLTTIRQPAYEIGVTAFATLTQLIAGEPPPVLPVNLPTELIVRRSVRPIVCG